MNKTLLLILCDFLLLNLLALTRWEKAEPPKVQQPPVPELAANAVTKDQDLVAAMRESLADEQATRAQMAEKLSSSETALAAREQSLTQLQDERTRLAAERDATQRTAAELTQKLNATTQEAGMTREQLAQLQRELADKQAEADRQKAALAALEKQQADARNEITELNRNLAATAQERMMLREQTEALKGQVAAERTERVKVQETATQLAQGVGQLAEKSGELTKEIRDNRPINANTLFSDFQANRVKAAFAATRRGIFGATNRNKETDTVLVSDGQQTYALAHVNDTMFALSDVNYDWESLTVQLSHGSVSPSNATSVRFLAQDPRIIAIPMSVPQAQMLGAKIYPLAADPYKFPDAVLIDGGGRGYGEVSFKVDPNEPGFVRVDNRLLKRLMGDFSPKAGDLVFARSGEILGIMVNSDYCAVLKDFTALATITPGADIKAQATANTLDQLNARVRAMPLRRQ